MTSFPKYPHFSRDEIIQHCRNWAREARVQYPDLTKINQTNTIVIVDSLTYLIRSQDWINYDEEHDLRAVLDTSNLVTLNHHKQSYWSQLFDLIDTLKMQESSSPSDQSEGIHLNISEDTKASLNSIKNSKNKLHHYARKEVIEHCKAWAENARFEYLELVTGDKDWAQYSTDRLTYPLSIQNWIDWQSEPELAEIVSLTEEIEQNHTSPAKWEKLIKLIDSL